MIRCIAVDDEPLALELIKKHCTKIPSVQLEQVFLSVIDAINYLQNEPADLIFLDINMPEIDGLNAAELIPASTQIVYVTAYEKYALKSYDLNATDYLLKPVSFERFYKAVQKCQEKIQSKASVNLIEGLAAEALDKTILLRGDKKIFQIPVREIDYIEGLKDYAKVFFNGNQRIIIRESLKKILAQLEDAGFIRVHRSYIIPMHKISSMEGNMIQVGQYQIPANKTQRDLILKKFKQRGILGDRSQ